MDIATKRGRLRESLSDRDEATSWLRMRSRLAETTASPWELFPLREACTDYAAELAGDDDGRNDDPVDPAGRPAETESRRPSIWAAERSLLSF